MSEQKEKILCHYSANPRGTRQSYDRFVLLLDAAIKMAPSTVKFTCPDIVELESRIKELEAENKRFRGALEREECLCSSSTGELRAKGPDSICNRCEALKDTNNLSRS